MAGVLFHAWDTKIEKDTFLKELTCIGLKKQYTLPYYCCCLVSKSCLTLLRTHGLQPSRLLCPWDFPGKNTGVGCHCLLQGIFLTQGLNLCLLHWQADSLPMSHQWSPNHIITEVFIWIKWFNTIEKEATCSHSEKSRSVLPKRWYLIWILETVMLEREDGEKRSE